MTKSKLTIYVLAILLVISSFLIGNLWTQTKSTQVVSLPTKPTISQASIDDDPVLGDKNAPITRVSYDFSH